MISIGRVEARLLALGISSLLADLKTGHYDEVELNFGNLKTAKTVQRLLYQWLTFFPQVKQTVSLRLNNETATLVIAEKGRPEKRGRSRIE